MTKRSERPVVLVVDDKPNMLALLTKLLGRVARVVTAKGVVQAVHAIESESFTAVVCDLRLADGDGLEVLRAVRASSPATPFILMTAYASVPTAIQAMREGAFDYVTKPFDAAGLRALVERALARAAVLRASPEGKTFGPLTGDTRAMHAVYELIERFGPTDAPVLVVGESGTGKRLVARALHDRSARASHRLVLVDCASTPRSSMEIELFGHAREAFVGARSDRAGVLEEAAGSTLVLHGVSSLQSSAQARLTRALEDRVIRRVGENRDRRIDVRLVVTSTRPLAPIVAAGAFRDDLFFRLKVCVIELPPLRDRAEDVPLLAQRFLADLASQGRARLTSLAEDARAALKSYRWPGNVRELESAVEHAATVARGAAVRLEDLPPEIRDAAPLKLSSDSEEDLSKLKYRDVVDASREETNRRYVAALLRRFHGDVNAAAEHAGVERESFYRLMRRHALIADDFRLAKTPKLH